MSLSHSSCSCQGEGPTSSSRFPYMYRFPAGADRILLHHTRKAGGTTMRMHMKKVAIQHQLPLIVREGLVVNDSEIQQPGTFTITSLREPVSRAFSSYQFEGAWPQTANSWFRAANPPLSLQEWAMRREASRPLKNKSSLRQYARSCYCKWFGLRELGTHEESGSWNQSLSDACAHARATLEHFDLVA